MRNLATEAAIAQKPTIKSLFLVVVLVLVGEYAFTRIQHYNKVALAAQKADLPGTTWIDFRSLTILDTRQGEDPVITHVDRDIYFNQRTTAFWQAAIHTKDTHELLCRGSGSSPNYSKRSTIKTPINVLKWWLGVKEPSKQCERWPFPVGINCVYTKWDYTPNDGDGPLPGPYPSKTSYMKDQCWETLPKE